MQLTGNYFWPTINGEVYYDKPLLSYWLIAASNMCVRPLLLTCHLWWNERFGSVFLFTLMLIVGVLTCRNLRPERIALSVFVQAYLFLLFLFVFAWPNYDLFRGEKAFADTDREKLNQDLSHLVLYRTSFQGFVGVCLLSVRENAPDSWIVSLGRHLPSFPPGAITKPDRETSVGRKVMTKATTS